MMRGAPGKPGWGVLHTFQGCQRLNSTSPAVSVPNQQGSKDSPEQTMERQ